MSLSFLSCSACFSLLVYFPFPPPFPSSKRRTVVGDFTPSLYLSPHTFVQTFVSAVESSVIVDSAVVSFVAAVAFGLVAAFVAFEG